MTTNHQTSIASLAKKRRTYSAEFKQQIVQACKAPDVSIASVALQHGLNTNLVSKWIRLFDGKPKNDRSPLPNKPAFIALSCSAPLDPISTISISVILLWISRLYIFSSGSNLQCLLTLKAIG